MFHHLDLPIARQEIPLDIMAVCIMWLGIA
jgi:hypothetical protein